MGQPVQNRRASIRRSAKGGVRVFCHANSMGLGPNVALSLIDVSETGARLTVNAPLAPQQAVEVSLSGAGHPRPVRVLAGVVWCAAPSENAVQVGLKFERDLSYRDLDQLGR